jgi:energy-coupling factor transport system ATP-binding protein
MIALEHIHFSYGSKSVLRDCSLIIGDGEITAITGENGSGKSTLALLMAGILQPSAGSIVVDGEPMEDNQAAAVLQRRIGMVFENPDNQFITTSVERELAFGLENLGVEPECIRERVAETIERFSLEDISKRAPHTLSGGEKQRVAIAATLIARPRFLILDEPTVFLDPLSRDTVRESIYDLKDEVTIIFISQFPSEILLADRIYELKQGCLQGPVSKETVFERYRVCDSSVQFLYELKKRGVFDGNIIPPIDQLCTMLEKRRGSI